VQNNITVEATGNYEIMPFTQNGNKVAMIYREVILPNGQKGYLSGINLLAQ
jgi:hypothetical protein